MKRERGGVPWKGLANTIGFQAEEMELEIYFLLAWLDVVSPRQISLVPGNW